MILSRRDLAMSPGNGNQTRITWPPIVDRRPMTDHTRGVIIQTGNDRLKGFAPFALNRCNAEGIMRETRDAGTRAGVSRITVRGFVSSGEMAPVRETANGNGLAVEAYVPMMNGGIAYFGWNRDDRKPDQEVRQAQECVAQNIMLRNPKTRGELNAVMGANGYSFDSGEHLSNPDIERLVELYRICLPKYSVELNEGYIGELTRAPENVTIVVRDGGRIIAAAVAEKSIREIDGIRILDVEISECATDPDHRGRGLMSAIIRRLMDGIGRTPGTAIYSESRAAHAQINAAMRSNGMFYCGRLDKAVVIGGETAGEDDGRFGHMESLNVWAITPGR